MTATEDLDEDAEVALAGALEALGVRLGPLVGQADLVVDLDGGRTALLEVKSLANATPARVRAKIEASADVDELVHVLVADGLPKGSRRILEDAGWGWYDRRGHLRLQAPGLMLDTTAPTAHRQIADRPPIAGRAGVVVAYDLLSHPDRPIAVRQTAAASGLNPSSISRALARLRQAALVRPDGLPLLPELFWALADVWPRSGTPLKRVPGPDDKVAGEWALTGTAGAVAWGAPLIATERTRIDLFVPSPGAVRQAEQRYGRPATELVAAAFLRVAPAPAVLEDRIVVPRETWPLAPALAVALDLATDPTRGAEVVESWSPPAPNVRVW